MIQSNVIKLIDTKVCKGCGAEKALGEFTKNKGYSDGRTARCRECLKPDAEKKLKNRTYMSARRKKIMADPEQHKKLKEKKNEWNRSEKYYDMYYGKRFGVSYRALVAMLASQNGLCGNIWCSCKIVLPPSEGEQRACVDHNHETGKVRALLCVRCNTVLGHIEKNQNLIPGLMYYLNKHN